MSNYADTNYGRLIPYDIMNRVRSNGVSVYTTHSGEKLYVLSEQGYNNLIKTVRIYNEKMKLLEGIEKRNQKNESA